MPIRLREDYENANGRLISAEPASVRFEAEARGGRWPLWFRFWLSGLPRGGEVELALANAREVLGGLTGLQHVRPLWREPGGAWERCAAAVLDLEAGEFRFTCRTGPGEIEVAFCHPFSYSDLRAWLRDLPDEVGQSELAVSPGGLSVPILRVGDPRTARHGIWVVARQHAGEAPGSWALQGLLSFFLSAEGRASGIALNIVPMMDADGVFRGDYGKTVAPDDFWEDWGGASIHPEVAATRAAIADWAAVAPYDLLLDLHAPTPSAETHAYGVPAPTPGIESERLRILPLIEAAALPDCPFSATAGSTVSDADLIARCTQGAQMAEHGALALCLELAYHRTAAGTFVGPDSLARLGHSVGAAVAGWLATAGRPRSRGSSPPRSASAQPCDAGSPPR